MSRLLRKWRQYKYRFVPWIAADFKRQIDRSAISKPTVQIDERKIKEQLNRILAALTSTAISNRVDDAGVLSERARWKAQLFPKVNFALAERITYEQLGFCIRCLPSQLGGEAGLGVFAYSPNNGFLAASSSSNASSSSTPLVSAGSLVSLYPGTFYTPDEPLFWTSLGNPFIFRCADGMLLDGNCRGLSAGIFRSILYRDSTPLIGHVAADSTWMASDPPLPYNPLSVGQFVNNATIMADHDGKEEDGVRRKLHFPNVAYYELSLKCPKELPFDLLQFLPYLYYDANAKASIMDGYRNAKILALVSIKDIFHGEELFSSYFSVVRM